jgi:hypothetical protein
MGKYIKHHYIPQFILKRFSQDNKVKVFNHIEFSLKSISTRNLFMVENLYDYEPYEDVKIIEKELASKIESPMGQICSRIIAEFDNKPKYLTFTRRELSIIKKYMMLQFYRTEGNMTYYLDSNIKAKNELSKYNIQQDETKIDFWKREMKYILDSNWEDMLTSDMLGVKKFADLLNGGYLGVFYTSDEFLISDLGKVAERMPIKVDVKTQQDLLDALKKYPQLNIYPDTEEILRKEFENQSSYVDNFYYFPISPNIALVAFDRSWLMKFSGYSMFDYLKTNLPIQRYHLPNQDYVNSDKILSDKSNFHLYKDENDKFLYTIQYLTSGETDYLNTLMMNEAMKSIAFKTPSKILRSVEKYMIEYRMGTPNVKRNYSGLISLLKQQIENND